MLPTTLVTIISVLVKLSCSSPVYNMQPAYITATIGSTGRNIRNLPCISRKSNQSGVCMFAIDCLKANGTHLGTCIDRFYFGSCCHIEPVHDIIENTIDTALIPSRQPPNRISTTTEKNITYLTTESIPVTTTILTTLKPTTTHVIPSTTNIQEMLTKLTTIAKITPTTPAPTSVATLVTKRPITTTTLKTITSKKPVTATTSKPITTTSVTLDDEITVPYKISTFQSVDGNEITTTLKPYPSITPPPRPSNTKPVKPITATKPIKPSSANKTKPATKPTYNITTIYRPTHKPVKVTTKPRPRPSSTKPVKITKPTIKPVNTTRVTSKPIQTTSSPPVKTTTASKIPATSFVITSKKPVQIQTTSPPKATMVTKVTSVIVTKIDKPSTLITQTEPTMTTVNLIKVTKPALSDDEPTTVKNVTAATESNELPINFNNSYVLESVNGNPATNEIESEKPIKPAPVIDVTTLPTLVTWSQVHDNATTVASSSSSEEPEDWVPITTPDGWVLLPSLSTVTEPTSSESSVSNSSSTSHSSSTSSSGAISTASSSQSSTTERAESTSSIETIVSLSTSPEDTNSATSTGSSTSDSVGNTTTSDSVTSESSSISPGSKPPVNMTDYTDVCGRRMFPEARIVGGEKSSFGKWPWQISLRQWRTSTYLHKCGAALLNENWAITAAHCVDNVPPSDLLLRLGEHDLSTESEPYLHQERRVQIVASHPQFDPRTFEYDLALLRFYEPVTFQPNIIPVCVPQNDENFVGRTAYVTGWGRLYEDGPLPSILQEVSVPVINNTVCESMYRSAGYIEHIPNIFICAGWRRGGFDSCEGDSGGPMVIQRPDKRFLLAGVISWGIGCAEPNQPGVYTRISEFRDWINQILQF